ncbi:TonB-dependent receptor [Salegentibacter sp. JZCK2]|uniref:TonB-dependent receptor family protein n=1 Tax=Salegentibacter tibetensis TaxID=2873600 RepID=UPI001CCDCFEB|nr:TonB-dependent receptor [Salegentibacter tibetensis]MBZ9728905.1 TonB-dependent receptor [Salegentibacter tibetensis]
MEKKLLALLCLLYVGNLFSQENQFKILNAKTTKAVEGASISGASGFVTISNSNGVFSIDSENLPGDYKISALGFEVLEINLKTSVSLQEIYLSPTSENLSEVLVRSTMIPKTLRKVPAAVNLITETDFNRTDATNVLETFNNVPGMYVNQGALNTNKINIRGIGARSQYSTNRIQAYFDGIPLTTAEGELTLDDFDQESLDRIEVIKGPTSSIYGAGLGGSINLYSKEPGKEEARLGVKTQYGSFNTQKQVYQASNTTANSALFATFSNLTSDGYRDNGNYDRKSALVNGTLKTSENGSLSYLANFTRLKAFIPSSLNEDDFLNNPETAAFTWGSAQGYESYDRGLLGGSYTHSLFDNFSNTTSIFLSFRDAYEPRPFNILKEERVSAGVRTKFNLNTQIFELPSEISFGAEYYNEWYETGTFENLYRDFPDEGSVLGDRLSNNEQDRNYANFFAQVNLEFSEKWNMEAGFNLNTTSYSLTDLYTRDDVDQTGDYGFDPVFSPRIGTSYEIGTGKNIFASVSHGFSTPTVAETLTPDGRINTNLEPETGINYEAGFKGNWLQNKLYTEVSVFSIQIEDLLVAQRVGEDQYVGLNAGKTSHNGVEFLTNYRFLVGPGISIKPYVNGAINFFEFKEFVNNDEDFSGNKLPGVPKYTMNLGVDIQSESGFEFYGNFRNVGEIPLDDANSGYTDQYSLLNFKAGYTFNVFQDLNLNLYGGVNNALDEHYAASVLTNAVGFGGSAPRSFYPGNPRNYYGGVQLNYIF